MISNLFLTDKISIVSTAYDEWSKLATTIKAGRPARVEFKIKTIHDKDGKEIVSDMQVFLKPDELIKYEDKIKIDEVSGAIPATHAKEYVIKRMDRTHGFTNFAIEVFL
jgi:hypothetical protein